MTTGADALRAALAKVAADLGAPDVDFVVERPRDPGHGDLATNLAMQLPRILRKNPRAIAEEIVDKLDAPAGLVEKTEIAGPGFINFFLAQQALSEVLKRIVKAGAAYGRSDAGKDRPVNVEFVSANPTGPLHVGHGRQAVLGDAVSRLLEFTGWSVTREFYYNDAGTQIENLTKSVQARLRDEPVPEGGYHGEYIRDIAQHYAEKHPGDPRGEQHDAVRRFAVRVLREEQDRDLKALGVTFDVYSLESALYERGDVEETMRTLVAAGHTYEQDGALWLRTTDYGDDKDRVMRKSAAKGGGFTYFVPDVAYHVTKWERGFARAVNIQGADHHGTVARVRIGLQALEMGIPDGYPEYVLHQMVTVTKGGDEVKISKRAGSYLTIRELIDTVGRDAVRYFLLMRKSDAQFVFDIDLATKQSEENPVYYVQYAHTRMVGIFRNAEVAAADVTADDVDLSPLTEDAEEVLMKHLGTFPEVVAKASDDLAPHRIVAFLEELARLVNGWYHHHRVLGEAPDVQRARLVLTRAAQIVLATGLGLLGVTAPERM